MPNPDKTLDSMHHVHVSVCIRITLPACDLRVRIQLTYCLKGARLAAPGLSCVSSAWGNGDSLHIEVFSSVEWRISCIPWRTVCITYLTTSSHDQNDYYFAGDIFQLFSWIKCVVRWLKKSKFVLSSHSELDISYFNVNGVHSYLHCS